MLNGGWAPAFPIDLVAKDFGMVCETAGAVSAEVPIGQATATIYKRAMANGFGDDNITGMIQLYS